MKTAIISDIHANFAALKSVLAKIDAIKCDRIICCGDLIGYGADANEVIDLVKNVSALTIRGNHEIAVLDPRQAETFNTIAREALFWTRSELTVENNDFLRNLRDQEQLDDIILAHGSLLDPDEYIYTPLQAGKSLEIAPCRITAVGHTHYPEIYRYMPSTGLCRDLIASEGFIELEEGYRYLINAGSAGQPRDGDWRASFAVYDDGGSGAIELVRVDYDVHATMDSIKKAGLPEMLADRLLEGR